MKQKTELLMWKSLLLTGGFLATLSSCGGGGGNGGGIPDPEPTPDPTPEVTTGEVTFTPDWGTLPSSSALLFHFYPATGAVVTADGDATGCKSTLENGTYRVLAYNTDATGVTFENTDSYDQAAVRVTPLEVPTRATSSIGQPANVYTLSMGGLTIAKGGTATAIAPVRASLVKHLKLNLTISNAYTVKELGGSLNGFLPSVLLSTGKPSADAVSAAPSTSSFFSVPLSGTSGTVELASLGMLDPAADGSVYPCELTLYVTDRDGLPLTTTKNVSKEISDILAANGGVLPDGTPAEITLSLTVSENRYGSTLTATVTDWKVGAPQNMVIKRIK